jgi:hypothetical protein
MKSKLFARMSAVLLVFLTMGLNSACSNDDDDSDESTAQTTICQELADVRSGIEDLGEAVRNTNASAADDAIDEIQASAVEIRNAARNAELSSTASQAASDFVGALDGLKATLSQVGQGGGSVVGLIQALEVQLPAISSAADKFRAEISNLSCDSQ